MNLKQTILAVMARDDLKAAVQAADLDQVDRCSVQSMREIPRVSLPFQVIETVNESRATRDARRPKPQASLFEIWQGNNREKPAQVQLGDCGKKAPISRHGPRYRSSS